MSPYPMDPVDATGPMRLVLVAAPRGAVSADLARGALRKRLAACVSTVPIDSEYWWEGRLEKAEESLLVFKTVPKRVGGLFRYLAMHHPYEVPEILELDVPRIHAPYLRYLAETIDRESPPLPLGGGAPGGAPRRRGSRRGRAARAPARTRAPHRRR